MSQTPIGPECRSFSLESIEMDQEVSSKSPQAIFKEFAANSLVPEHSARPPIQPAQQARSSSAPMGGKNVYSIVDHVKNTMTTDQLYDMLMKQNFEVQTLRNENAELRRTIDRIGADVQDLMKRERSTLTPRPRSQNRQHVLRQMSLVHSTPTWRSTAVTGHTRPEDTCWQEDDIDVEHENATAPAPAPAPAFATAVSFPMTCPNATLIPPTNLIRDGRPAYDASPSQMPLLRLTSPAPETPDQSLQPPPSFSTCVSAFVRQRYENASSRLQLFAEHEKNDDDLNPDLVGSCEWKALALEFLNECEKRAKEMETFRARIQRGEHGKSVTQSNPFPKLPRFKNSQLGNGNLFELPENGYTPDQCCGNHGCFKQREGVCFTCTGCERPFHLQCMPRHTLPDSADDALYCGRPDCPASVFVRGLGDDLANPRPRQTFNCISCFNENVCEDLRWQPSCGCKTSNDGRGQPVCVHCIHRIIETRGASAPGDECDEFKCPLCRHPHQSVVYYNGREDRIEGWYRQQRDEPTDASEFTDYDSEDGMYSFALQAGNDVRVRGGQEPRMSQRQRRDNELREAEQRKTRELEVASSYIENRINALEAWRGFNEVDGVEMDDSRFDEDDAALVGARARNLTRNRSVALEQRNERRSAQSNDSPPPLPPPLPPPPHSSSFATSKRTRQSDDDELEYVNAGSEPPPPRPPPPLPPPPPPAAEPEVAEPEVAASASTSEPSASGSLLTNSPVRRSAVEQQADNLLREEKKCKQKNKKQKQKQENENGPLFVLPSCDLGDLDKVLMFEGHSVL